MLRTSVALLLSHLIATQSPSPCVLGTADVEFAIALSRCGYEDLAAAVAQRLAAQRPSALPWLCPILGQHVVAKARAAFPADALALVCAADQLAAWQVTIAQARSEQPDAEPVWLYSACVAPAWLAWFQSRLWPPGSAARARLVARTLDVFGEFAFCDALPRVAYGESLLLAARAAAELGHLADAQAHLADAIQLARDGGPGRSDAMALEAAALRERFVVCGGNPDDPAAGLAGHPDLVAPLLEWAQAERQLGRGLRDPGHEVLALRLFAAVHTATRATDAAWWRSQLAAIELQLERNDRDGARALLAGLPDRKGAARFGLEEAFTTLGRRLAR